MAQAKAAIFLTDGFEEVEAVTPIDYLRRAGIEVLVAGVGNATPTGARGLRIAADTDIRELPDDLDAVILPGGMPGAANLAASDALKELCKAVNRREGLVAAICAAPALALGGFGLLTGRQFTCYPGFEEKAPDGEFTAERVVKDGNLITSRGPATAADFAIEIIRRLAGEDAAREVAAATLLDS